MSKIRFTDPRTIQTIELPSFAGSAVVIYSGLTVGEQRAISAKFPNAQDPKSDDAQAATLEMICKAVKEWNFSDVNEQGDEIDLPITPETLNKFPLADLMKLAEVVTGQKLTKEESSTSADEKKNI